MIWLAVFVALMLHGVDWLQTRWISKNGAVGGVFETNRILGKRPTLDQVNVYFLASAMALIFAALTHFFIWSESIAYFVLSAWAAVELWVVVNNYRLKVGMFW